VTLALVGLLLHRPGLWFLFGFRLPASIRWPNRLAALITAAAMIVGAIVAPHGHRGETVAVVWAIGHALWGLYVARAVLRQSASLARSPPPHDTGRV
jgi:hypothetical protein